VCILKLSGELSLRYGHMSNGSLFSFWQLKEQDSLSAVAVRLAKLEEEMQFLLITIQEFQKASSERIFNMGMYRLWLGVLGCLLLVFVKHMCPYFRPCVKWLSLTVGFFQCSRTCLRISVVYSLSNSESALKSGAKLKWMPLLLLGVASMINICFYGGSRWTGAFSLL
jgi:hypothetical protein